MAVLLQSKINDLQEELENTRTNMDKLYKNKKDTAAVGTQKTAQPPADNKKQAAEVGMDKLVCDFVAALAKQEWLMANGS